MKNVKDPQIMTPVIEWLLGQGGEMKREFDAERAGEFKVGNAAARARQFFCIRLHF